MLPRRGSSPSSVCRLALSSPSKSRGDVATLYPGVSHNPSKPRMCSPKLDVTCLVEDFSPAWFGFRECALSLQ